jgi:hypothetical protein
MSTTEEATTKEPRLSKRTRALIVRGAVLLAVAGAGIGGGWTLRGGGTTASSATPTPTTIPATPRSAIIIGENADGTLVLDGQSIKDLDSQLRETHLNAFSERVPVTCEDSFDMIRSYFAGNADSAAVLEQHRGDIEAISGIARNLCVYEQYRRFLNNELFGWLYPVTGGANEAGTTTSDPDAANDPAAVNETTTTVDGTK